MPRIALSGQTGGSGYMIQSFVAAIDSLADDCTSLTVEPDIGLEKADII